MISNLELSENQKTFWYLYHTEGDHPFYHVGAIYQLSGRLEKAWFEEIFVKLISLHESLQTAYEIDELGNARVSVKKTPFQLIYIDCSVFPENQRKKKAQDIALREFNRPFALEKGDLLHSALIQVSPSETIWTLSMSHVIADLFSYNLFIQQFKALYEAKLSGQAFPFLSSISIEDIHLHERDLRSQDFSFESETYWKNALNPLPLPLVFPTDKQPDAEVSYIGENVPFLFDEQTSQNLVKLAQKLGISLFTLLKASVAVFLNYFSKEKAFMLGYESANRMTKESHAWIWPRVNQLCIKIQGDDQESFAKFAQSIQGKLALSFKYQDYPFHRIPGLLNLNRGKQTAEFLPVKILMEPPGFELTLPEMEVKELKIPNNYSPFPLVFRFSNNKKNIEGEISFQKQLFQKETVERWKKAWISILNEIIKLPDVSVHDLNKQTSVALEESVGTVKKFQFQRKAISLNGPESVHVEKADPHWDFPIKITKKNQGIQLDIWLQHNKDIWNPLLTSYGAVLFRGFNVMSPEDFEKVALAVHPEKVEYVEPSQPRAEFKEKIYISTEYPPTEILHQHSELNYTYHWPLKGLFCCVIPAKTGGETPLADNREILGRMDPSVLKMFIEKGVMYQRNYGDGLLVPWQKVFKTEDPRIVEEYCKENAPMTCEWKANGGLRTRQIRPSFTQHPMTQERVWFNQSYLFHAGSLGRHRFNELLKSFAEEDLPAHSYFGDGTPITFEQLEHVYDVMRKSCLSIPWEKGDVVLVDNVLISHGRNPYTGDRKILACFVEPQIK